MQLNFLMTSLVLAMQLFSIVCILSNGRYDDGAHSDVEIVNRKSQGENGESDDTEEYRESGTKFMLDECASGYMRSRIQGREVLLRMEAFADKTYDQRMLIYGHSSTERNNVEFYLSTVRHLEANVELMSGISLAVEQYKSLGVWTTQLQQRRLNILLEFQKHLLPGERGGALATSFTSGKGRDRMRRNRRKAKRYLPDGRIPELDTYVAEYMKTRAAALTLQRQARALVGFMSDGLPKRWASLYLEVMAELEEKGGLARLKTLAFEWEKKANKLSMDLLRREKQSGDKQYSYGGKGDPDGRLLVLSAFDGINEWIDFVAENNISPFKNHKAAPNDVTFTKNRIAPQTDATNMKVHKERVNQAQDTRQSTGLEDTIQTQLYEVEKMLLPPSLGGQNDDISFVDMWYTMKDLAADAMFHWTQFRLPNHMFIFGNAIIGGLIGALVVIVARKVSNCACPARKRRRKLRPPPSPTRTKNQT